MTRITLDVTDTILVAIVAYFFGRWLTTKIGPLDRYRIPEAVTGGLVAAILVAALRHWADVSIAFTTGEIMMLAFFSTIGLNARFSDIKSGGAMLTLTVIFAAVAIVVQNLIGVGFANLFGAPPAAGIMAGSVALAGGHGTAAAWAPIFEGELKSAAIIGLATATFGLVAGGVLGGPLGQFLIKRNSLESSAPGDRDLTLSKDEQTTSCITAPQFFSSVLAIALAIGSGGYFSEVMTSFGLNLPKFVSVLLAGILIGNLGPMLLPGIDWPLRTPAMRLIAELSLSLFLVRTLMSLELWALSEVIGPLFVVLLFQAAAMLAFALLVVFPLLGRSYDAAVIASGFIGLTLGATPTAVANMSALTHKYGPSQTAFIVIPLVGAFFVDITNALVVSMAHKLVSG